MQGLPITTVYSKSQSDISVGSKTQYGYVISKQSTFRKTSTSTGNVESYVYNCCANFEQLSAAIGVASQYEATNLPQTGIVDRFIYVGKITLDASMSNCPLYFGITSDYDNYNDIISNWLLKPLQKLQVDGKTLYICECVDNYCFDYQKTETAVPNYYLKKAIPYADDNNYIKGIYFRLYWLNNNTMSTDLLNNLPKATSYKEYKHIGDNIIYKDPRERLIFVAEEI